MSYKDPQQPVKAAVFKEPFKERWGKVLTTPPYNPEVSIFFQPLQRGENPGCHWTRHTTITTEHKVQCSTLVRYYLLFTSLSCENVGLYRNRVLSVVDKAALVNTGRKLCDSKHPPSITRGFLGLWIIVVIHHHWWRITFKKRQRTGGNPLKADWFICILGFLFIFYFTSSAV